MNNHRSPIIRIARIYARVEGRHSLHWKESVMLKPVTIALAVVNLLAVAYLWSRLNQVENQWMARWRDVARELAL
jgi:hypothetical protein